MQKQPKIWVLKTPNLGDVNNRIAIAKAISPTNWQLIDFKDTDHNVEEMLLKTNNVESLEDVTDWPDIFIVCEQASGSYSRKLKEISQGRVFVVGMQTPDIDCNDFEKGIGNYYDYKTDLQVLFAHHKSAHNFSANSTSQRSVHDYVPTYIDPNSLNAAFYCAHQEISSLKARGPVFTIVVGSVVGTKFTSSQHVEEFIRENVEFMTLQVADAARTVNGSVLVTTSRRTGEKFSKTIEDVLQSVPFYMYDWSKSGGENNCYVQMLSAADRIIVSSDSISMVSDALAFGKPTFVYVPSGKPNIMKNSLLLHSLAKTKAMKKETCLYMQKLAAHRMIFPMRSLTTKTLRTPMPYNSAHEIAESVLSHYERFKAGLEVRSVQKTRFVPT